jgi:hypothetical protein
MSSLKAAIAMPQQWKSAVGRTDFKILPLVKTVFDILLPIALTAGVALVIIVGASFLLAKGNAWQGYEAWLGFIYCCGHSHLRVLATRSRTQVARYGALAALSVLT